MQCRLHPRDRELRARRGSSDHHRLAEILRHVTNNPTHRVGKTAMRLSMNAVANPVPGEQELIERLKRIARRADGKEVSAISVRNLEGQHRLKIVTHTEAEDSGTCRLLEDRQFEDLLYRDVEETDSEGFVEFGVQQAPNAEELSNGWEFSAVYAPKAP